MILISYGMVKFDICHLTHGMLTFDKWCVTFDMVWCHLRHSCHMVTDIWHMTFDICVIFDTWYGDIWCVMVTFWHLTLVMWDLIHGTLTIDIWIWYLVCWHFLHGVETFYTLYGGTWYGDIWHIYSDIWHGMVIDWTNEWEMWKMNK